MALQGRLCRRPEASDHLGKRPCSDSVGIVASSDYAALPEHSRCVGHATFQGLAGCKGGPFVVSAAESVEDLASLCYLGPKPSQFHQYFSSFLGVLRLQQHLGTGPTSLHSSN